MNPAKYKEHFYRIAYEAFSQFSGKLFKCRSFDDVQECLVSQLKYLFEFKAVRISFNHQNTWVHSTISPPNNKFSAGNMCLLLKYEEKLRDINHPVKWTGNEVNAAAEELGLNASEVDAVWGWSFGGFERSILITLVTERDRQFDNKEVTIMKLFAENLEAKLLELALFNELERKNGHLNSAMDTIVQKNQQIESIVDHQKEVIKEQTHELEEKNRKLVEITRLNAHSVREPLSRILGLSQLAEHYDAEMTKNELLPKMIAASEDLDEALQEIIQTTDKELSNLKA